MLELVLKHYKCHLHLIVAPDSGDYEMDADEFFTDLSMLVRKWQFPNLHIGI